MTTASSQITPLFQRAPDSPWSRSAICKISNLVCHQDPPSPRSEVLDHLEKPSPNSVRSTSANALGPSAATSPLSQRTVTQIPTSSQPTLELTQNATDTHSRHQSRPQQEAQPPPLHLNLAALEGESNTNRQSNPSSNGSSSVSVRNSKDLTSSRKLSQDESSFSSIYPLTHKGQHISANSARQRSNVSRYPPSSLLRFGRVDDTFDPSSQLSSDSCPNEQSTLRKQNSDREERQLFSKEYHEILEAAMRDVGLDKFNNEENPAESPGITSSRNVRETPDPPVRRGAADKLAHKRKMNAEAARRCRERKAQRIHQLESQVIELIKQNAHLKANGNQMSRRIALFKHNQMVLERNISRLEEDLKQKFSSRGYENFRRKQHTSDRVSDHMNRDQMSSTSYGHNDRSYSNRSSWKRSNGSTGLNRMIPRRKGFRMDEKGNTSENNREAKRQMFRNNSTSFTSEDSFANDRQNNGGGQYDSDDSSKRKRPIAYRKAYPRPQPGENSGTDDQISRNGRYSHLIADSALLHSTDSAGLRISDGNFTDGLDEVSHLNGGENAVAKPKLYPKISRLHRNGNDDRKYTRENGVSNISPRKSLHIGDSRGQIQTNNRYSVHSPGSTVSRKGLSNSFATDNNLAYLQTHTNDHGSHRPTIGNDEGHVAGVPNNPDGSEPRPSESDEHGTRLSSGNKSSPGIGLESGSSSRSSKEYNKRQRVTGDSKVKRYTHHHMSDSGLRRQNQSRLGNDDNWSSDDFQHQLHLQRPLEMSEQMEIDSILKPNPPGYDRYQRGSAGKSYSNNYQNDMSKDNYQTQGDTSGSRFSGSSSCTHVPQGESTSFFSQR